SRFPRSLLQCQLRASVGANGLQKLHRPRASRIFLQQFRCYAQYLKARMELITSRIIDIMLCCNLPIIRPNSQFLILAVNHAVGGGRWLRLRAGLPPAATNGRDADRSRSAAPYFDAIAFADGAS